MLLVKIEPGGLGGEPPNRHPPLCELAGFSAGGVTNRECCGP
jgi:hypothetical protein